MTLEIVAICSPDGFYVLKVNKEAIEIAIEEDKVDEEDVNAFDLIHEFNDVVTSGTWVGDCFVYTVNRKLQYCVGGQSINLAHLDRAMYI